MGIIGVCDNCGNLLDVKEYNQIYFMKYGRICKDCLKREEEKELIKKAINEIIGEQSYK